MYFIIPCGRPQNLLKAQLSPTTLPRSRSPLPGQLALEMLETLLDDAVQVAVVGQVQEPCRANFTKLGKISRIAKTFSIGALAMTAAGVIGGDPEDPEEVLLDAPEDIPDVTSFQCHLLQLGSSPKFPRKILTRKHPQKSANKHDF